MRPTSTQPQAQTSINVIHLGGRTYIHSINECMTWSEAGCISSKQWAFEVMCYNAFSISDMVDQKKIQWDDEYKDETFVVFCSETGTELFAVAASYHKASGLVENRSHALRFPTIAFNLAVK